MSMFNDTVYQAFLSNPEKFGFTYEIWKEWYSKQLGKEFKDTFPELKKKYFAHYIPVDGLGDKDCIWQWENNVQGTGWEDITRSDMDAIIAHGLTPTPKFRKLKLFLCSRDTQVGDKIKSPELIDCVYDSNIDNQNIRVRWENDFMTTDDKRNYFKVIGEISPDATWVKEGDEFLGDEADKDCEIFPLHIHGNKGEIIYVDEYDNPRHGKLPIYMIKCSNCGHFH